MIYNHQKLGRPTVRTLRHGSGNNAVPQSAGLQKCAFALFILMIVFNLLSIPSRIPMLGTLRPTLLLAVLILLLILASVDQLKNKDTSRTTHYLNILVLYMVITLPFVRWPGTVLNVGIDTFIKAVVFFYFAVYLVNTFQRLQIFIKTILVCQLTRVFEPLYLHLTTGYWGSRAYASGEFMDRLSGAPNDIIGPNGLAFVILTTLPFLHYLLGGSKKILSRLLYVTFLAPLFYTQILTGSRSGLICLILLYGIIIIRSKYKVLLGLVAATVVAISLSFMTADFSDRYLSIVDSNTKNSATAEGRTSGVIGEFQVGLQRPLFGHGLGTSREALVNVSGRDQIAHNLYTEVFIELGAIGLVIYLTFLFSVITNVSSVLQEQRRMSSQIHISLDPTTNYHFEYYQRLAAGLLAYFLMALVFSLASYGLSEHYWYMAAGLSVALRSLMIHEIRQVNQPEQAKGPHGNVRRIVSVGATRSR